MKHLRKEDGYVMVYVLIVFTILSLVAGSICSISLKNLQVQKADVTRMQARYEAEGVLQECLADVAQGTWIGDTTDVVEVVEDIENYIENIENMEVSEVDWEEPYPADTDKYEDTYTVSASVQVNKESVSIEAKLRIPVYIELTLVEGTETISQYYSYVCEVKASDIAYDFYNISYSEGGGT